MLILDYLGLGLAGGLMGLLIGIARGKHGMRRAKGLPPLRPADAPPPMHTAAHEKTLG